MVSNGADARLRPAGRRRAGDVEVPPQVEPAAAGEVVVGATCRPAGRRCRSRSVDAVSGDGPVAEDEERELVAVHRLHDLRCCRACGRRRRVAAAVPVDSSRRPVASVVGHRGSRGWSPSSGSRTRPGTSGSRPGWRSTGSRDRTGRGWRARSRCRPRRRPGPARRRGRAGEPGAEHGDGEQRGGDDAGRREDRDGEGVASALPRLVARAGGSRRGHALSEAWGPLGVRLRARTTVVEMVAAGRGVPVPTENARSTRDRSTVKSVTGAGGRGRGTDGAAASTVHCSQRRRRSGAVMARRRARDRHARCRATSASAL